MDAVKQKLIAQAKRKQRYEIPIARAIVAPNNVVSTIVAIMPTDGYFLMRSITGTFTCPTTEVPNVAVAIQDTASGNNLTEGYVELVNFLSPGLLIAGQVSPFVNPFEMEYLFDLNAQLKLDFINRSTIGNAVVNITLHGWKYFT
jgi:hypothetical protein